jgi:hypothetical protein
MATINARQLPTQPSLPWWRYGHVWMVIGGPLVVVVASITTYMIAVSSADGLVNQDPVAQSAPQVKAGTSDTPGLLPAVVGRNHAATAKSAPIAQ